MTKVKMILVQLELNPPDKITLTLVPPEAVLRKNVIKEKINPLEEPERFFQSMIITLHEHRERHGMSFQISLSDYLNKESGYTLGQEMEWEI